MDTNDACWLCTQDRTTIQPYLDTPCTCGAPLRQHREEHPHAKVHCDGFLAAMPVSRTAPEGMVKTLPEKCRSEKSQDQSGADRARPYVG